jgi:hypothetical protein
VPAALLAASLQGAFSAHITTGPSPAGAMRIGNMVLYGRFEGKFATMFYAVVAPDGTCCYCNAGHNPPLLVRADGRIEKLEVGGCVLGLFEGASYDEARVALGPGDMVILFSDGLPEAIDEAGNDGDRISTITGTLGRFRERPSSLAGGFVGALMVQAILVLFYAAVARSFSIPISTWHMAVVVPVSFIVQMLPVSVNGLGVREATFSFYFSRLGLPIGSAMALSLGATALTMAFSLTGAACYVVRRHPKQA